MSQAPPVDVPRTAPETEISLGRELRRAREVRGISIEQIARETKINERYLHALENDRIDLLPGQLYARNFVRAVAREIGADEEELLDYFNYQVRLQDDAEGVRDDVRSAHATRRGVLLLVIAISAVLLIVLLTISLRHAERPEGAAAPGRPARLGAATAAPTVLPPVVPPAAPAGDSTAARSIPPILQANTSTSGPGASGAAPAPAGPPAVTAPAGATGAAASGPATSPQGPAPTLKLSFTGASWVEIQREGDDEPFVGMKQPGESMTYALDKPLTLTILNSAAASISVDGQAFRQLGGPQEKRTITLDRKNYQQYLKK